jgi:hypothetical protein
MKQSVSLLFTALSFSFFMSTTHAEEVVVSGCVEQGVEGRCLILRSGNKVYDITAASPRPQVGTYGVVSGSVSHNPAICMQGTRLSPAKWKEDKTRSCSGGK